MVGADKEEGSYLESHISIYTRQTVGYRKAIICPHPNSLKEDLIHLMLKLTRERL